MLFFLQTFQFLQSSVGLRYFFLSLLLYEFFNIKKEGCRHNR